MLITVPLAPKPRSVSWMSKHAWIRGYGLISSVLSSSARGITAAPTETVKSSSLFTGASSECNTAVSTHAHAHTLASKLKKTMTRIMTWNLAACPRRAAVVPPVWVLPNFATFKTFEAPWPASDGVVVNASGPVRGTS